MLNRKPSPEPQHTWGDWRFWLHRGICSSLPPECIDRQLETAARDDPAALREAEAFLNHQHPNPSLCSSRAGVRLCLDIAAELGQGLRSGWPGRTFEIFCGLGQDYVTFNQAEPDVTLSAIDISEPQRAQSVWTDAENLAWCGECGRDQPFTPVEEPDIEFPMLQWCRCAACGTENVLGWCGITFRVGPGLHQELLVGNYVPQADASLGIVTDRVQL